jgi:hypothetical protein
LPPPVPKDALRAEAEATLRTAAVDPEAVPDAFDDPAQPLPAPWLVGGGPDLWDEEAPVPRRSRKGLVIGLTVVLGLAALSAAAALTSRVWLPSADRGLDRARLEVEQGVETLSAIASSLAMPVPPPKMPATGLAPVVPAAAPFVAPAAVPPPPPVAALGMPQPAPAVASMEVAETGTSSPQVDDRGDGADEDRREGRRHRRSRDEALEPVGRSAGEPEAAPTPVEVAPQPVERVDEGGTGALSVASTPACRVYLDSRLIGTTPISGRAVGAGRHTLYFVSEDGRSRRVSVVIRRGETTQIRASLD